MFKIAAFIGAFATPALANDNCDLLRELHSDYFSLMNGIVQIGGTYQNSARDQLEAGKITNEQAGALNALIVQPPLKLGGAALAIADAYEAQIDARCN